MNIRDLTRAFLDASRWNQEKLAQAIGVHVTSLNRYLHHQRRRSTGEKLAEFLIEQASAQISFTHSESESSSQA